MQSVVDNAALFRHVTADKALLYRNILDLFAAAKRQYRLQLRPDEVLFEAAWASSVPRIEDVNAALVHCVIDLAPGESDGKDRHIST